MSTKPLLNVIAIHFTNEALPSNAYTNYVNNCCSFSLCDVAINMWMPRGSNSFMFFLFFFVCRI